MSRTSVRTRQACAVMALSLALGLTVNALGATSGEASAQSAPSPRATVRPRVAFVGDSIGHSAESQVRQALGDGYQLTSYDSVNGSTIAEHRTAVTRLLQSAARPEILVIELGTNDAEHHGPRRFDRDLRAMLDLVSPRVAEVRWYDQKDTPTGFYRGIDAHAAMFNRILRAVAARYPNVSVVPYADWARSAPPGSFLADRLHLTARGAQAFARITRDAVDQAAAELVAA